MDRRVYAQMKKKKTEAVMTSETLKYQQKHNFKNAGKLLKTFLI